MMGTETINDHTLAFNVTPDTPSVKFVASLSDGRTVIQDNREGQRHAWARLAEWMKNNKHIFMTELRLHGPNGIDIKMPSGQKGYFFGQKTIGVFGGFHGNYIGVGYYDGEIVNIMWYRQPKFDQTQAENRTVAKSGFFLIVNQ